MIFPSLHIFACGATSELFVRIRRQSHDGRILPVKGVTSSHKSASYLRTLCSMFGLLRPRETVTTDPQGCRPEYPINGFAVQS